MLTVKQEKLIRSLATNKGRLESGFCLVEGEKNVSEALSYIEFTFTPKDTEKFEKLVTSVTPQPIAAVARIPQWTFEDIARQKHVVVLDGVQDPGNVGTILRLCLGFDASLMLIESADPSNPKVVRSSAGAFFNVPWLEVKRAEAKAHIADLQRPVYRLEYDEKGTQLSPEAVQKFPESLVLIAGSEGQGIKLHIAGTSLSIPHNSKLESLNVANAVAIVLAQLYQK